MWCLNHDTLSDVGTFDPPSYTGADTNSVAEPSRVELRRAERLGRAEALVGPHQLLDLLM